MFCCLELGIVKFSLRLRVYLGRFRAFLWGRRHEGEAVDAGNGESASENG